MAAEGVKRVAVLISGRGSNLGALIAASGETGYPAQIVLVVSDRSQAGGLAVAGEAGITTVVVRPRAYSTKAAFEAALDAALRAAEVEIVCLAGYMRLLSPSFVERWRDRMINIHPSLLPDFPGLNTHERALQSGEQRHGATVHFVRARMDTGPIIVQGAIAVLPGDTPDALAKRLLTVEHRIYPIALALVAGAHVKVLGDDAFVAPQDRPDDADLIWPIESSAT